MHRAKMKKKISHRQPRPVARELMPFHKPLSRLAYDPRRPDGQPHSDQLL